MSHLNPREIVDVRLVRLFRDHDDRRALDRVVARYQPFLRKTVRPYLDRGQSREDLMQVANLGLMKAINGFDLDRGGRLISYVAPTIQGEIKRHFRDHAWALHVPRSVKEAHAQALAQADGTTDHGDPHMVRRLAERAGHDDDHVENVVAADRAFRTGALDVPLTPGGASAQDAIGSVDDGFDRAEDRATIEAAFRGRHFTRAEQRMLVQRHVLGWHQHEIAADIGHSQMHVSRKLRLLHERLGDQGRAWGVTQDAPPDRPAAA